jgi:hypothetical protein
VWLLWFLVSVIESLLLIVLWHGGAIDQAKAQQAVNNSMSKLASLFKRKDQS